MNNLRVILLDDEVLIRKLIRMKMDAKRLNLEIVGEFSNAEDALSSVDELKPDIVISDICMPEVDGLSFSEQLTNMFPGVKIIIVTGYNDFEYARRSVKVGVFDYLMKPVQTEELNNALEKAAQEIYKERSQIEREAQMLKEREQNIPVLRDTLINQILMSATACEDVGDRLAEYGIRVSNGKREDLYIGLIVVKESINNPQSLIDVKEEVELFFQSETGIYILLDAWGRIVIMCYEENASFLDCFELLVQMIREKWNYHIQTGISLRHENINCLRETYAEALESMKEMHERKKDDQEAEVAKFETEHSWEQAISWMNQGNVQDTGATLHVLLDTHKEYCTLQNAGYMIQKMCIRTGLKVSDVKGKELLSYCRCQDDIKRCIEYIGCQIAMQKQIKVQGEKGVLMSRIMVYIEEHLSDETLNMNMLTEAFGVSVSVLSRMFKQYTGTSYSEVVSQFRYWKMLQLLASDPDMLDRDIGEMIGIMDPHYLSIWFRKVTGYSVTECRKMKL